MTVILINRTGQPEAVAASDGSLTVTVPIRIKRRGLRKTITLPDGDSGQYRSWDAEPTPLQLALARGHRWLALLEAGEAKSMKEIARREGVDNSYVSRMVNLTTLAPDIVAAFLDATLPPEVTLFELAVRMPLVWDKRCGRVGALECRSEPLVAGQIDDRPVARANARRGFNGQKSIYIFIYSTWPTCRKMSVP
jgi:hypothetical protein